jgi:hypothetical protein
MRPSLRDSDIRSQGAQPTPKEFSIGVWIVIAIIIGLLIWLL